MSKPARVLTMILALLFLGTAIASFVGVILQINKDKESSQNNTNQTNLNVPENKNLLKGTKLEGFKPVSQVSKLQVVDLKEGEGAAVKEGATVTAHYTGALAKNGTIFESSKDSGQPATFPLSQVIKGWQEGVPGMKVGGIRRLIIPASLAYGEKGSPPTIGPNEPLIFDIELVSVE